MSEEMIAIIITSIISLVSLIISLKNYLISKPKLKIVISDKECDSYFGCVDNEKGIMVNTNIGAAEINIINNSPVDIFVKDIKLKIGKNYHGLIDKENSYWEGIHFFYYAENGEKMWEGFGIDYKENGFSMPTEVKSYTILSGICLFHHFPNNQSAIYGKIILNTAVGKITKRVKFIRYDNNYVSSEMKNIEIYQKFSFK